MKNLAWCIWKVQSQSEVIYATVTSDIDVAISECC